MECKCAHPCFLVPYAVGINRYIMECKCFNRLFNRCLVRELIDTLWNVNDNSCNFLSNAFKELIDTLWNVNYLGIVDEYHAHKN